MTTDRVAALVFGILFTSLPGPGVTPSDAATHVVDPSGGGDFLAIQPALNAAAAGDTVQVVAGTFTGPLNKDLDFGGKDILLFAPSGPAATVIDGEGSGRAFNFHSGETSEARVAGFTITRAPTGSPIHISGGSSPVFANCTVIHNEVTAGAGGGIAILASSPRFVGCRVVENSSTAHGGGIVVDGGAPVFTDCMVIGNRTHGEGGGIRVSGGAQVSISGCTVSGNRAALSGGGFNGGGVSVDSGSSAALSATILWGNGAPLGEDLFVDGTSSAAITCCDLDLSGVAGSGAIDLGEGVLSIEPHFCRPAYNRSNPWSDGDYTLGSNSPCLAAHNPCGVRIGAGPADCGPVVAWTGSAGTTAWEDSLNWSTQALPGPGDHVQLTRGNVELSSHVSIGVLTQCPESDAVPDTLTIADGGGLCLEPSVGPEKDIAEGSISTGRTIVLPGGYGCTPESEDGPWDIPYPGILQLMGGSLLGPGPMTLQGRLEVAGGGASLVEFAITISGAGDEQPAAGLYLLGGTLDLAGSIFDQGRMVVAEGAVLASRGQVTVNPGVELLLDGLWANESEGIVDLAGDLPGTGLLANRGLVRRVGPGVSMVGARVRNVFDDETGERGTLRAQSGFLALARLENSGDVVVEAGAEVSTSVSLTNGFHGSLIGAGVLDAAAASFTHHGLVSPGFSPGVLSFTGSYVSAADSRLFIEIGGTMPGSGYDQLRVQGSADLGGALHVSLIDGFVPQPGDTFEVVTITGARPAEKNLRLPGFDCYSGTQLPGGLYLAPVALADRILLVATDTTLTNSPPLAAPDWFVVLPDAPAVLSPLANDSDPDGDGLSLVSLQTAGAQGRVFLNVGGESITYVPPAGFFGPDMVRYIVTDCAGGIDSARVTIEVREPSVVPGDPEIPAELRLESAYPNPFRDATRLTFALPRSGPARLAVYDVRGRLVRVLAGGSLAAGRHQLDWGGEDGSGHRVAGGVYYVRLRTAGRERMGSLVVIR